MSLTRQSRSGYGLVIVGFAFGAFGKVTVGLICIAMGTLFVSFASKPIGRVERYLPIALALALLALALALPGGR